MTEPVTKYPGDDITSEWANSLLALTRLGQGVTYVVYKVDSTYYARNATSALLDYSGPVFSSVLQSAVDATTGDGGTILIKARTYPCTTTVNIKTNVTVLGEGVGTIINKTAAGGTYEAIFNLLGTNTNLYNMRLNDMIQTANTKLLICYPSVAIENIHVENVYITNSKHQGIVFSAPDYVTTMTNILINNVKVDSTGTGAGIVVGVGVQRATVENCEIIEPGHTGIDVWGCSRYIRVLNNYVYKNTKPDGIGIAISASPDDPVHISDTTDIKIAGNKIEGPIQYDGITVWTGAKNLDINDNTVDGALRHGINVSHYTVGVSEVYAKKTSISGNTIRNVGSTGITVERDVADVDPNEFIIRGNRIESPSGHGIRLYGGKDTTVTANIIEYAGMYGIFVEEGERTSISGNIILYPQQADYGDLSGITLWGQNNTVVGNLITGDAHLIYSIFETAYQGNNAIFGNIVNKPMFIIGDLTSYTKTEGNIGYQTENCGTTSGTSPITVAHHLVEIPNVVLVTPKELAGYATSWEADATNLTIYHTKGTSAYVSWLAKYEPPSP